MQFTGVFFRGLARKQPSIAEYGQQFFLSAQRYTQQIFRGIGFFGSANPIEKLYSIGIFCNFFSGGRAVNKREQNDIEFLALKCVNGADLKPFLPGDFSLLWRQVFVLVPEFAFIGMYPDADPIQRRVYFPNLRTVECDDSEGKATSRFGVHPGF